MYKNNYTYTIYLILIDTDQSTLFQLLNVSNFVLIFCTILIYLKFLTQTPCFKRKLRISTLLFINFYFLYRFPFINQEIKECI